MALAVAVHLLSLYACAVSTVGATERYSEPRGGTQWRPWEKGFDADGAVGDPAKLELTVWFTGPGRERYEVPAFWDGGLRWTVRFSPTTPGEWSYATTCPDNDRDPGLHCEHGTFNVAPPEGSNPLFRHGGILQVSPNRRYLTYSDGTPFFWLGDTWWFCPSTLCPLEGSSNSRIPSMFKTLVDTRKQQGFTVAQMTFLGPDAASGFLGSGRTWSPERSSYWQDVDRYFAYANEAGLVLAIGIGFHRSLDPATIDDLKLLWRYMVARYGAFAVTWLIVGEYNLGNVSSRVQKVLDLGRYIKEIDPYHRAMTVHPAYYAEDHRQAWSEPWHDFIMLQGGHGSSPVPLRVYRDAYDHRERKPILEGEAVYEGIHGLSADRVRHAAYRAIQSGSFGYTYGAHGLWYPSQNHDDRTSSTYGPSPPWWEALALPGGPNMRLLRDIYESVDWWKLEPRPDAVLVAKTFPEEQQVFTKADGDVVFVIYFPAGFKPGTKASLQGADARAGYFGIWVNPRDGSTRIVMSSRRSDGALLPLPAPPDQHDWVLLLGKTASIDSTE